MAGFAAMRPAFSFENAGIFFVILDRKVALVTGATRGVGRGVAPELAQHGARLFITGRSADPESATNSATQAQGSLPGAGCVASFKHSVITAIRCDHRLDDQMESAFSLISQQTQGIDILVNNVWGGYEKHGRRRRLYLDETVLGTAALAMGRDVSALARTITQAPLAAPTTIARGRGLIVNISYWAAQKQIGNAAYGASKAATGKKTSDMAVEFETVRRRRCYRFIPGSFGQRRLWNRQPGST